MPLIAIAFIYINNFNNKKSTMDTPPIVEPVKIEAEKQTHEVISPETIGKPEEIKSISENHHEVKINPSAIVTPAIDPKKLPSLEEFKKSHPEVKVVIEKLNSGSMIPGVAPGKSDVKTNKLEKNQMFPTGK